MAGQPVSIGPFFGGLNDINDPSTIDDNQCSAIENFDIDTDGSLVSRPTVHMMGYEVGDYSGMDSVVIGSGRIGDQDYLLLSEEVASSTHSPHSRLALLDPKTQAVTTFATNTAGVPYSVGLQYDNKFWFVGEANGAPGGYWSPQEGWKTISTMPHGVAAVIYKERLFIAQENGRILFSKIGDFETWTIGSDAGGFFDVSPGDHQKLCAMVVSSGQIVIFKEDSTYVFAYDSAPERASVQQVSSTIGTVSREAVTVHEGIIYTVHDYKVYAINNWRWINVSARVNLFSPYNVVNPNQPEEKDYVTEASLSVVGRRIVLRYRQKYWAFFPDMEAWVSWKITYATPHKWVRSSTPRDDGHYVYWSGSYYRNLNTSVAGFYRFIDGYPTGVYNRENFIARIASKMYDYDMPYNFKRLHWWGIDLKSNRHIDVKVYPESYSRAVTWDMFKTLGLTWDQSKAQGRTWDRPMDISINVSDSYDHEYIRSVRAFVKFIKSLRFRKIVYELSYTYGSVHQEEPVRIFSAMALITAKQLVPRKSN